MIVDAQDVASGLGLTSVVKKLALTRKAVKEAIKAMEQGSGTTLNS